MRDKRPSEARGPHGGAVAWRAQAFSLYLPIAFVDGLNTYEAVASRFPRVGMNQGSMSTPQLWSAQCLADPIIGAFA